VQQSADKMQESAARKRSEMQKGAAKCSQVPQGAAKRSKKAQQSAARCSKVKQCEQHQQSAAGRSKAVIISSSHFHSFYLSNEMLARLHKDINFTSFFKTIDINFARIVTHRILVPLSQCI